MSGSADHRDDHDPLRRAANAWVARLASGLATQDDADNLRAWRASSPQHEAAFREAARLWKNVGELAPRDAGPSRRSFLVAGSLAASVAAVAGVASMLGWLPHANRLFADYSTGIGEQRAVTLADGSVIELDADTRIDVAFDDEQRRIDLLSGAAVLTIVEDVLRPLFVVAADGSSSTAGGSLAITRAGERVSVACIRGLVQVTCRTSSLLEAGDQVDYDARGLAGIVKADANMIAPWRRGMLVFEERPLDSVVLDINRYRRGRVVIADRPAGRRRVSGVFHLSRPNEIIDHIEGSLGLRRMDLPGGVTILG